jgi:hypothetical protein
MSRLASNLRYNEASQLAREVVKDFNLRMQYYAPATFAHTFWSNTESIIDPVTRGQMGSRLYSLIFENAGVAISSNDYWLMWTTAPSLGPVAEIIENVYQFEALGRIREGIQYIFSQINRLLSDGAFDVADAVLANIDVNRLGSDLILSFLTITRAARGKLPYRIAYLDRARHRISEIRGAGVADRLLRHMAD